MSNPLPDLRFRNFLHCFVVGLFWLLGVDDLFEKYDLFVGSLALLVLCCLHSAQVTNNQKIYKYTKKKDEGCLVSRHFTVRVRGS